MATLIPGNSQVLTYRDIRTALGLEATIELVDALRTVPTGYDGCGAPIYPWQIGDTDGPTTTPSPTTGPHATQRHRNPGPGPGQA